MEQNSRLYALRGATGCDNTEYDIQEKVAQLFDDLLKKNDLKEADIVSIQFTITQDLNILNPAAALRRAGRAQDLALFVAAEPDIRGMLPGIIRILIHCYLPQGHQPRHVYINGAEQLRPDRAI